MSKRMVVDLDVDKTAIDTNLDIFAFSIRFL